MHESGDSVHPQVGTVDHRGATVFRVEQIMGMPIEIDVRDPGVGAPDLDEAFAWLREVDRRFSTYREDSEICRLNRGEMTREEVHPDVADILDHCEELRMYTEGYFDARATGPNGPVDPSGLVKGWSVERSAALLQKRGLANFSVNAGGDIVVRGSSGDGEAWRIGIRHPRIHDKVACVVEARDLAIATSGGYERGTHILDPHTGEPSAGVLSVTIAGRELGMADAYATAAFAMGIAGPEWTRTLVGYQGMTMLADDRVLFTEKFPRRA